MRKSIFFKIGSMILCMLLMLTIVSFANTGVFENDIPEIVVEVLYNEYDEDFISEIVLDDGTVIGDHDYEIIYLEESKLTRDPVLISAYFNYAAWITRDGVKTLSLDPKDIIRYDETTTYVTTGWNILKDKSLGIAANSAWPTAQANIDTFYWQYLCHYNYAKNKDYWNLEPNRVANSYTAVVTALCNP